jgi:hypothetical protein
MKRSIPLFHHHFLILSLFSTSIHAAEPLHHNQMPWFIQEDASARGFREAYPKLLSRTLLNGREVALVDEGRTFLFSPGEFSLGEDAKSVKWFETRNYGAQQVENTAGAMLDIRHRSPLSLDPRFGASASIQYNEKEREVDHAKEFGELYSLNYVDHFMDQRLGLKLVLNRDTYPAASMESNIEYAPTWDHEIERDLYGPKQYSGYKTGGESDLHRNYLELEWDDDKGPKIRYDLLYTERNESTITGGFNFDQINGWPNIVSPTPEGNEVFQGIYSYVQPSGGWPKVWRPITVDTGGNRWFEDERNLVYSWDVVNVAPTDFRKIEEDDDGTRWFTGEDGIRRPIPSWNWVSTGVDYNNDGIVDLRDDRRVVDGYVNVAPENRRDVIDGPDGNPRVQVEVPPDAAFISESKNSRAKDAENLLATGLNAKWETPNWNISADFAYSRNKLIEHKYEIISRYQNRLTEEAQGGYVERTYAESVTLNGPGSFIFTQDLTDPNLNKAQELRTSKSWREVERGSVSLAFTRLLDKDLIQSIEFGLRGTIHQRKTMYQWAGYEPADDATYGASSLGKIDTAYGIDFPILDIDSAINNYFKDEPAWSGGSNDKVTEQTAAIYSKINFSRTLGKDHGLKGDVGIRLLEVDLKSKGWESGQHDYHRVLPSFNLSYFPLHGNYSLSWRAARRIAKLHPDAVNPLDPWDINDFSLRLDWHYAKSSTLSLGLEYKHLATYTTTQGYYDKNSYENENGEPVTDLTGYLKTRSVNADDAYIRSIVVKWSRPFSFLDGKIFGGNAGIWVDGILNKSNAEGRLFIDEAEKNRALSQGYSVRSSLPGLKDTYFRSGLWYWRPGGVKASLRHTYNSGNVFDLDITYSPNQQLAVFFKMNNLAGNDWTWYYDDNKSRPGGSGLGGRSYEFGINRSF